MNVSTYNFAHYRLTAGPRNTYILFDRQQDLVLNIAEDEFNFIMNAETIEDRLTSCREVVEEHAEQEHDFALHGSLEG
jgi:hypothetical protein